MSHSLLLLFWDQQYAPCLLQKYTSQETKIYIQSDYRVARYTQHHKQKLAFMWSSLKAYHHELIQVFPNTYLEPLELCLEKETFFDRLDAYIRKNNVTEVRFFDPSEYQIKATLETRLTSLSVTSTCLADPKFICSTDMFEKWAKGKKSYLMESFYRTMRQYTGLLMEGKTEPTGGKWNLDHDNRARLPADYKPTPHKAFPSSQYIEPIIDFIEKNFSHHVGNLHPFTSGTSRQAAEEALTYFIDHHLPTFGQYQDAMSIDDPFIHHSLLSHYMNVGLLDPMHVCKAAELSYHAGKAPLNSVEGFIRQIIGWREYMRGIYWLKMPGYDETNFFAANRELPSFYWTGKTSMNCLKHAITNTLDHAYAHHIQRLMITANYATLAGVKPQQVNEWYYVVYIDAFEWVQLPNTHGMGLFADGGMLSTKPYVSSGAYINRMSNYCHTCPYNVKEKTGPSACPFNYLYWNFLIKNKEILSKNPRIGLAYQNLARMKEEEKALIESNAAAHLGSL